MNKVNKKSVASGFTVRPGEWFLYRERLSGDQLELGIRKVDLRKDLALMYQWVNQPYAYRFWGMQGTLKKLYEFYYPKLEEGHLQLFFACITDIPVALIEVYPVLRSELAGMWNFTEADYGIHLLMAPYREIKTVISSDIDGLSVWVLKAVQRMLFDFSAVQRIVAEPDEQNIHACRLAEKAGFHYLKTLPLEGKVARLYMIARHEI
ncbi:acetyltransferase [Niabella sp. CC-SYL272]|uniref:GNAT family N-acetyltransferase n=1 Tax=Niabella agricola TaxID=2891571 RepID=UPI001F26D3D7|nr:GNAT family N-acetyltransferase [Niabella agricola]MCF3111676.1 acetyltransferase [Niabella agricola]